MYFTDPNKLAPAYVDALYFCLGLFMLFVYLTRLDEGVEPVNPWSSSEFHGTPLSPMELYGAPWTSMEPQGAPWSSMELQGAPWNSLVLQVAPYMLSVQVCKRLGL